ncbi:hypothetical protein GQ464_006105 [Rhodocaloribacter litoris]|uniref:hypothetical protein n=1 Tax=Rhodocaloribacter litoris TaxID=2558931 RepID=UPI00141F84F6|nr:hypothetical protein [Rhodocaloribacter litoris]QXD16519.1 hypothetical protein GQ464_006105 [Rhodocaloribacter litoris]
MATLQPSIALSPTIPRLDRRDIWLVSPFYDLTFIIFSSVLLVFPHISHAFLQSNIYVDLIVTMLIGGPHLFATYTMTLMEPDFRRRYPVYARGAYLLPVLIVTLAVLNLTLLVTIFFFWASVHVIHQAAYVADAYRMKDPRGWRWTSRIIDYGLLFTSLYPIATSKLIHSQFETGGRTLLFPDFLRMEWLPYVVWVLFLGFLAAFLVKTVWEYRHGLFHGPKTLHMAVATGLFLITPTLENLDVAFQGLNVWHSFQYLAVVLYLNRLRARRGLMSSRMVQKISGSGFKLYGMCLAFTLGAGVLFLATLGLVVHFGWFETGQMMGSLLHDQVYSDQHYFAFYSVVLSFLLIHYYFDHFIFLGIDEKITPAFAPLDPR